MNIGKKSNDYKHGEEKTVEELGERALREYLAQYSINLHRQNLARYRRNTKRYLLEAGLPVGLPPLLEYGPVIFKTDSLADVRDYLEGCERAREVPQEDVIDLTSGGAA